MINEYAYGAAYSGNRNAGAVTPGFNLVNAPP
jgi:hypothetical protein